MGDFSNTLPTCDGEVVGHRAITYRAMHMRHAVDIHSTISGERSFVSNTADALQIRFYTVKIKKGV